MLHDGMHLGTRPALWWCPAAHSVGPQLATLVNTCGRVYRDLGRVVQDRLTRWAIYDPALFTNPACDLVIVDRGHDPVAPAIHPFHYASMAHDLVDLQGGIFRCFPPPALPFTKVYRNCRTHEGIGRGAHARHHSPVL